MWFGALVLPDIKASSVVTQAPKDASRTNINERERDMQQNIKHGLLVDCNSEITEEQMSALISGEPITDHYVLDKDYFAR